MICTYIPPPQHKQAWWHDTTCMFVCVCCFFYASIYCSCFIFYQQASLDRLNMLKRWVLAISNFQLFSQGCVYIYIYVLFSSETRFDSLTTPLHFLVKCFSQRLTTGFLVLSLKFWNVQKNWLMWLVEKLSITVTNVEPKKCRWISNLPSRQEESIFIEEW